MPDCSMRLKFFQANGTEKTFSRINPAGTIVTAGSYLGGLLFEK